MQKQIANNRKRKKRKEKKEDIMQRIKYYFFIEAKRIEIMIAEHVLQ